VHTWDITAADRHRYHRTKHMLAECGLAHVRAHILLYAKGEQCAREAINTKNICLHLWESVCFRMGVVGGGFICRWWCRIRTCRRIPDSLIPLVSLLTAFAPCCFPPAISCRSCHPTPLCTLLRLSSTVSVVRWHSALPSL
jgi:hypothetical protein